MELLDRYLQAVRKYLPLRRQDDIIAELRANMESQIEDRESELGRPLTQGEADDFLRKMGHPMVVAARYQPQQYLIGPTLFPLYLYVLRIALRWAFIICMLVTAIVTPLTTPGAQAVFDSLFRTPGILLQVAAWVTLAFAVIDFARTKYPHVCPPIAGITENWNPSSLPPLQKPDDSGKPRSFAQAIAEIVISVLFLGWVLLIPHHPFLLMGPGALYIHTSPFQLAPVWWTFYWLIIAFGVLQIVWKCIDLGLDKWQRTSRVQHVTFKVLGLVPMIVMLDAPGHIYLTLKNPALDQLRYGQSVDQLNHAIRLGLSVLCAIILLQLAFDLGKWLWERYRNRVAAAS